MNKLTLIGFLFLTLAWGTQAKVTPTAPVKSPAKTMPEKTSAPQECTPSGVAPPIVGPGYSDPKFCCEGNIIIIQKAACMKDTYGGFAGLCAPCGNKKCDTEWEDACNCPEDCSLMAPPPVKSSSSSSSEKK